MLVTYYRHLTFPNISLKESEYQRSNMCWFSSISRSENLSIFKHVTLRKSPHFQAFHAPKCVLSIDGATYHWSAPLLSSSSLFLFRGSNWKMDMMTFHSILLKRNKGKATDIKYLLLGHSSNQFQDRYSQYRLSTDLQYIPVSGGYSYYRAANRSGHHCSGRHHHNLPGNCPIHYCHSKPIPTASRLDSKRQKTKMEQNYYQHLPYNEV